MSTDTPNELANFHQFIGQQLGSNRPNLSPEEALDLWRERFPGVEAEMDATEALREAIAELESGEEGMTVEEFDREFRRRHDLGPRT